MVVKISSEAMFSLWEVYGLPIEPLHLLQIYSNNLFLNWISVVCLSRNVFTLSKLYSLLTYSCSQFGVRTACRVRTKLQDSHFPVSKLPKMLRNQVSTILACRQATGEWNRIRSLEINSHIHGQLTFDKVAKTIPWGKNCFQQVGWMATGKRCG